MAQFFIDRPVFATVLSIVIMIVGGVALVGMPVAQYPEIVPPTIAVQTAYPGASAQVVADTVTTPIEQEVNGVEGMLYLASKSTNDGQAAIDVTFSLGTDIDQAQVLTQNRVAVALAKLPEEVKRQGVVTKKKSPSILLCVNLVSPDSRYDLLYLSNYALIQVKDALARIEGVGDVAFLGARAASDGNPLLFGETLRDNEPMLALARKTGLSLKRHPEDSRLVRLEGPLPSLAAAR